MEQNLKGGPHKEKKNTSAFNQAHLSFHTSTDN